jgi:transcriptional regulator GlxA family with amidase domain
VFACVDLDLELIDLALALVRETHGNDVALAVAKRLVVVAQR